MQRGRPKTGKQKSEDELYFSLEEQDRLFSYWSGKKGEALKTGSIRPVKTWFLFKFVVGSGLRAFEACNVKIKDLNLESKTPHIVVSNGKGGKRRLVYIGNALVADIKWYLNYKRTTLAHNTEPNELLLISERGTKMSAVALYKVWFPACKKALGQGYGVHAGRHTFCYNLYGKENNIEAVRMQAGHSSLKTTQRYIKVTPEDITRQMNL